MEKNLIKALKKRVGDGVTREHDKFDLDFSEEMKKIYGKYKDNDFVAGLYCESLMNLRPWNLWCQQDHGEYKIGDPYPKTLEIKTILEKHLKSNGDHPYLRHLYIHLMELSPIPE